MLEHVSGPVSFNAHGDPLASYEFLNQRPDSEPNAATGRLNLRWVYSNPQIR